MQTDIEKLLGLKAKYKSKIFKLRKKDLHINNSLKQSSDCIIKILKIKNALVYFLKDSKNPGGFYQNLNSAILLNEIKDKRFDVEFLVIEEDAYEILKKEILK